MNNQTAYWLWIQQAIGYGNRKISYIINHYTFAEDFFRAPFEEKLMCGNFTKKDIEKLKDTSLDKARKIIQQCKESNIEIVTIGDVAYPERLLYIDNPPAVLYVKGNLEVISEELSIAMVGTRNSTPYGMRTAFQLSADLAANGAVIISGGALGIDTYSHRGALNSDGKTVCVLGCGINYKYLRENDEMKKQILRRGAVISEYPPDTPASRYTFPQRNRIISGLSKGVLIVEAGKRSGSLITAELALEQGRDVFAVPGDISSDVSFGTNELIKDGAVPVTSAADVIEYYGGKLQENKKPPKKNSKKEVPAFTQIDLLVDTKKSNQQDKQTEKMYSPSKPEKNKSTTAVKEEKTDPSDEISSLKKISKEEWNDLSENSRKVLSAFDSEVLHIDRIVERTGLAIGTVHSILTKLEMFEYIEMLEGRNYKILVSI